MIDPSNLVEQSRVRLPASCLGLECRFALELAPLLPNPGRLERFALPLAQILLRELEVRANSLIRFHERGNSGIDLRRLGGGFGLGRTFDAHTA